MILPPKLKSGDTIAVFSPSSPATKTANKRYLRGKQYLENKGFTIFEGSLTGNQDYYRSGSILERANELNELIRNPTVNCIMSAIGGENSNSILPYIDYEAFSKNPKIIIGYSDVTALLLGIYAKTNIVTFYGPALVASFGELPPFVDLTYKYFNNIVGGNLPFPYSLPIPEFWTDEFINWDIQETSKKEFQNELIILKQGKSAGRLIGGNLNTMQGIWGSQYMPEIKRGDILLIEDSLKNAATVERSFSLLKVNGVFDRIGGLILGKHEMFDDCGTGKKPYEILEEVMGDVDFPILAEFDCCHTHPMLTMPIGCEVELDATNKNVSILEKFVY
jgi:muramoyltetrapeptide carboxypeptidase LdcA involved in peptidoglycan recycling